MLGLEHRMFPLEGLQPLDLTYTAGVDLNSFGSPAQKTLAGFLPPARQHEGMDIQGLGHGLHLDPGM